MIAFLFIGEGLLSLFHVDLNSFAVAGGIIIFIIALEMILGINLMKSDEEINSASVFPISISLDSRSGNVDNYLIGQGRVSRGQYRNRHYHQLDHRLYRDPFIGMDTAQDWKEW